MKHVEIDEGYANIIVVHNIVFSSCHVYGKRKRPTLDKK